MGLSGIDFADEHPMQRKGIARAIGIPDRRLTLVNDGIAALWGATVSPAAVILQHGTGFTSAYRSAFGRETLFDQLDAGAIFDLRTAALTVVARMIDGRLPASPLKAKVLRHFAIPDEKDFAESVYRRRLPEAQRLTLAALIFTAWEEGEPASADLVRRAIDDYAVTATAMMARTTHPAPDTVFGGGVLTRAPDRFWREIHALIRRSYPQAVVKPPDLPPEYGAAIMAAHGTGLDPGRFFITVLDHYHER